MEACKARLNVSGTQWRPKERPSPPAQEGKETVAVDSRQKNEVVTHIYIYIFIRLFISGAGCFKWFVACFQSDRSALTPS